MLSQNVIHVDFKNNKKEIGSERSGLRDSNEDNVIHVDFSKNKETESVEEKVCREMEEWGENIQTAGPINIYDQKNVAAYLNLPDFVPLEAHEEASKIYGQIISKISQGLIFKLEERVGYERKIYSLSKFAIMVAEEHVSGF